MEVILNELETLHSNGGDIELALNKLVQCHFNVNVTSHNWNWKKGKFPPKLWKISTRSLEHFIWKWYWTSWSHDDLDTLCTNGFDIEQAGHTTHTCRWYWTSFERARHTTHNLKWKQRKLPPRFWKISTRTLELFSYGSDIQQAKKRECVVSPHMEVILNTSTTRKQS